MKKMNGSDRMVDEREKKILGGSLAASTLLAYVYLIGVLIYKFLVNKSFRNSYSEIGLLSVMLLAMTAYLIVTMEYDSEIEKPVKTGKKISIKLDERQKEHIRESLATAAVVGMFTAIFLILFKLIMTRKIGMAYMELGLLIVMSMASRLYNYRMKEFDIPKEILDKNLDRAKSGKERILRYKYYARNSLITAILFVPVDLLTDDRLMILFKSRSLSYLLNLLGRFLIFFIINSLLGEFNLARHNKYYKRIENEDEID